MTEDLRRRLAETAAGARNSIADDGGGGGAASWLDKLCRAEVVADWPEQRLRDTSEMLDVLSETGRQARAVAAGIQPVAGSGFAAAVKHRLPLNRKERYYTGTVLPMIVAGDGFRHLHRLLDLCGLGHVPVHDDSTSPWQGHQDIQFFTEYSFAESVFRAEDKHRFDDDDRPLEADTPDLVISGGDWLLAIEAKMYHRPSTLDIETQMSRQRKLIDYWREKFHVKADRTRQIALLPAQFVAVRQDLSVPVLRWERVLESYTSVAPAYWLGVLRVALESYDKLCSPDATGHTNNDAWMRGDAIHSQYRDGTIEYAWMGRTGGLDGGALRGDLKSDGWRTQRYEVRQEALPHPHRNWFEIRSFVAMVDKPTGPP